MRKPTKPFWDWVAEQCALANLSQAALAQALDVTPQTLASWKQRNQFRRDLIDKMNEALKLTKKARMTASQAKDLKVQFIVSRSAPVVNRRPIEAALQNSNKAYRRMEKTFERYAGYTLPLVESLGENCFFTFSACTTSPYEFETIRPGAPLAEAMARALFRGALLLYVRPTPKGVAYYEESWGYGRVVPFEEAKNEIRAFRAFVEAKLVAGTAGFAQPMSTDQAKAWLHERLVQCYMKQSPMWMPGVGLGMVGWMHARDLKSRMTISLPGGFFGGVLVYPQYFALEYRFTRVLRWAVRSALTHLDLLKTGQPTDEEFLLPHLSGGSDPILPHTEQFFRRMDRLLRTVSSHDTTTEKPPNE